MATDANGLTAECTFDVLVLDNQDPSVSCVSDQTRNTDDGFCAYSAKGSEFDPSSYSDNCSVVSLGYVLSGATTGSGTTSLSGVVFEIGVTNVQWTVTDVADNTSFCSFTVTIRDAHAPSVSCVDNQVEETDLNSCTYEHSGIDWDATALDICPEDLTAAELERLAIIETFDNAWGYRTYTGPGSKKGFEWTVNEQSLTSCGENRMRAYFEPSTRDVYVLISSTLAGERFYSLIDGCYGIRGTGMPTAMMNVITSDNVYQAKSGSSTINIYDGDGNKRSDSNIQSDAQNMALAWIGNPFNRFSSLVGNVFSFTLVGMLNDAPNVHDRTKFEVDYNFRFIQSTASGVHNASLYYRVSGGIAQGRTLAEAKTDAISELEAAYATYNPNHYTPENWTALTNAKNAGIADVNTVSGSPHPVWVTLNQKKRSALKAMENIPLMGVPLPVSYVLAGATTGNGISLDGIEFNVGTTIVTWTAMDANGNTASCSYTVTVEDKQVPTANKGTIDNCYTTVALAEAAAIAATTNRNDNCTAPEELVVTASTTGTCEAVVTVRVTDACGLYSEYSYNTRIDNTIPVITLLGSSTVEICQNETYIDAGATASDNCDGDISASVVATGSVDTNVPGSYTLYYNVKDNCGNDAVQVTRSVTVLAKPSASILPDPAYMIVGGSVSLNGNPSGGSGTYSSHEWTGDGAAYLSSTSVVNPTFNGAPVGTYHLTYSVTDNAGCLANDVITVTVYGKLLYVNDGTMDGDEKWCTAIGNDSNPGTSNAPLLTISKAVSVAEPGSIIYVDAGTYTEQVLVQKDLTLLGAGEGESIIKAPASGRICAPGYMTETWTADDPDYVDYVIAAYPADPVSGDPISVKIRDFTIDADGQTRSCDIFAGVYFRKVKEEEIADAGLFNSGIKGFNASDQNTFGIFVLDGAQLTIGSNDISTAYTGVSVWGTDNLVDPVVTTSYNRVSGNIGISYSYINNPALADDVVNNTMYSCNIAISALDCDHLMIAHNEISATRFGVYSYGGGEGNTISDNTISGSNSAGPEIGINLLAVDQHVVEGNTVTGSGTSGTGISVTWITQGSSCSHQILSNVVSDFGTGMNIATANNLIEGNFISDCSGEGIFVSQTGNSILHNDITTCNIGVNCYGPATINYNKIYGNTLYGLQNVYDSEANPGEVDAKMNWWGDPSGPYRVADNPCGAGNRIYGIGTGGNYDSYADNNVLICDWYTNEGMTQLNGCTTAVFAVTGGGAYCSGGDGVAVGLAGSETGVNYTLVYGTTNVTTLAGTGSALDFGLQTQAGTYSVTATNTITGCILPMPSSVIITVNQYATITLSSVAGTDVQVLCLGDEIEQIAYDIEGMVDNASVSGLPAGLAANYSAGVLIIGGTPTETGSFTYTVNLTGTCATATATGTITVYDEFNPGVIASTGESICYGCDPIEIGSIENASGGNGTIEYKWQSSTDGTNYEDIANSNSATYDPSNLYQTTYFKRFAKDETCNPDFSASSGIWVVTISDEGDVWGTYRYYFGDVNVPLEGVKVTLLGVGNTYSTTTNAAGEYVFETVEPGTYTVTSSYDEPTEGAINSLDAGMVNSWQVGPQYEIEKVRFKAADVIYDNRLTAGDAGEINFYYLRDGNPAWKSPVGLWTFWRAGEQIAKNPFTEGLNPVITVGTSPILQDFFGLITGDFNLSATEAINSLKSARQGGSVLLHEGKTMRVSAGSEYLVPFTAGSEMRVGAFSLTLGYRVEAVEILGVFLGDDTNMPVPYNILNNKLRIGWYSNDPANPGKGEALFSVKVRVKPFTVSGEAFGFSLIPDRTNEIGDAQMKVIPDAEIYAGVLEMMTTDAGMAISADHLSLTPYPIPAGEFVNLSYTIPVSGNVTLAAYDLSGRKVAVLIDENQAAGTYNLRSDLTLWSPGVYFIKLDLKNDVTATSVQKKMVKR